MTATTESRSWRRVVPAAAIDVLLVLCPSAIAVAVLHERFPFSSAEHTARFGPADQARIDEINGGFSRAFESGDALYVLSGSGWWLSLGLLVALTVAVYVVVPALAGLRTPGLLLFGVPTSQMGESGIEFTLDLTAPVTADELADEDPEPEADTDAGQEPGEGPATIQAGVDLDLSTAENDAGPETITISENADDQERFADGHRDESSEETDDTTDDAADIDITERRPVRPITLADEDDYRRWDQELGGPGPIDPAAITVTQPGFDALALPESSLSDAPLTAATLVRARSNETSGSTSGPGAQPPVWNDDWNAWLYWDTNLGRWFRHDTGTGRWTPLG